MTDDAGSSNDTLPRAAAITIAVVGVAMTAARFGFRRELWLDEALSVNIAQRPIGELADALRHDGHPPLYYAILGRWIDIVGTGAIALRSLSAIFAAAATWPVARLGAIVAGRRGQLTAMALWALSPFVLRFGSEVRMYSLVLFATAGVSALSLDHVSDAGPFPGPPWTRPVLVGAGLSLLLWTHYWSLWFAGGLGVASTWWALSAHRHGDIRRRNASLHLIVAIAVAGLSFIPWLGVLRYQAEHTGTPWADPLRPAEIVVASFTDFFGGPYSEPQLLMFVGIIVMCIGLVGTSTPDGSIRLRWRVEPDVRDLAVLTAAVVAVAGLAGAATRSAFAARYAAVFYPLVTAVFARGLAQFRGTRVRTTIAIVGVLAALGACWVSQRFERTQAGEIAEAVGADQAGKSAVVVVCPDQLGPATDRAFEQRGLDLDVVRYPDLESARFVDWVDYAERNERNDPAHVATELLAMAGHRPIALVLMDTYLTLEGQCADLLSHLAEAREPRRLVEGDSETFFEPMNLFILEQPR